MSEQTPSRRFNVFADGVTSTAAIKSRVRDAMRPVKNADDLS